MLGKGHRDTDGCRAADGEIDEQKQTEMEEVKDEPGRRERKSNKRCRSWMQGSWKG